MPFPAKYEGRCDDCLEAITIGQQIVAKTNGTYTHDVCDEVLGDLDLKPTETVCDRCFMVRALDGSCDCGAGLIRDESEGVDR